jgi:hypothetical protein
VFFSAIQDWPVIAGLSIQVRIAANDLRFATSRGKRAGRALQNDFGLMSASGGKANIVATYRNVA